MRTVIIYLLAGLCAFLFSACHNKVTSKEALIDYIKDEAHGTIKSATSSGILYRIAFRPVDLIVEHELKANKNYNKDSLKDMYSDCLYFTLSLSRDSMDLFGGMSDNFEELLKKISFDLRESITLNAKESGTVFYVADYIYPRMFHSTGNTTILLCFKDKELRKLKDFSIQIKDFVNETDEVVVFDFLKKSLDKTPYLVL